MPTAKDLRVEFIRPRAANAFIRRHHYSGRVVNNSQLHLGVFLAGRLCGCMQFGPPMVKRGVLSLVRGTKWHDMLELNRLAMVEDTPPNSESRVLAVAFRLIRKRYPHIEWILSYADATQCGDGTIYRACGFALTQVKPNETIWRSPPDRRGRRQYRCNFTLTKGTSMRTMTGGGASMRTYAEAGWEQMPGFQLRYVYFLNPAARGRLTVPEIPYSAIAEAGASMYRGERRKHSGDAPGDQLGEGGSIPTPALQ